MDGGGGGDTDVGQVTNVCREDGTTIKAGAKKKSDKVEIAAPTRLCMMNMTPTGRGRQIAFQGWPLSGALTC